MVKQLVSRPYTNMMLELGHILWDEIYMGVIIVKDVCDMPVSGTQCLHGHVCG